MNVVTITIEEQTQRVEEEHRNCLNKSLSIASTLTNSEFCPINFDKIMCWPVTEAGEISIQACPSYVNGLRFRGKASRICLENGEWNNYTDFKNCLSENSMVINSLNYLGHVGYGISFICLGLSILIMISFRKLSCSRNTIHLNVFVSFLLRATMHFINLFIPSSIVWLCRLCFALDYWTITASHTWICIEALFLHNSLLIHLMRESSHLLSIYVSIGWGVPCLLAMCWAFLKYLYGNKECWNIYADFYKRVFWLELLYPCVTTLINLLLFMNITRVVYNKATDDSNGANSNRYRKIFKATAILVIVFGIYDVVLIPLILLSEKISSESFEIVQLYYEHTMTSCQGFFVSLLFCFINSEVSKELKRFYRKHKDRRSQNLMLSNATPKSKKHTCLNNELKDINEEELYNENVAEPLNEQKSNTRT